MGKTIISNLIPSFTPSVINHKIWSFLLKIYEENRQSSSGQDFRKGIGLGVLQGFPGTIDKLDGHGMR